jgi:hypothetical protein
MYLVVGGVEDVLAREVFQQAGSAKLCSEADLLESCITGNLDVDGKRVPVERLSGAIVRPHHQRWQSAHTTLQSEDAEYHDRIASLYSFFTNLACPVVNRFGLSWWVEDISYPWQLRMELEAVLGLTDGRPKEKASYFGRLWPSARRVRPRTQSVYVSGGLIRAATDDAKDFEELVESRSAALRTWQQQSGVHLCRLDFDGNSPVQLWHVEPFPMFDGEPESLVRDVAISALSVTV